MDTPKRRIDFKGQFSSVNAHAAPLTAQENMTSIIPGQLTCRPGMRAVTFSGAGSATAYQVTSMTTYLHPLANWIVYCDSNGSIFAGRTPA